MRPRGNWRAWTSAPPANCRQLEKARRATFTVPNDGTEEQLRERLAKVLAELERRFAA